MACQMWDWFPFPKIVVYTDYSKADKAYRKMFGEDFALFPGKCAVVHYCIKDGEVPIAFTFIDSEKLEDCSLIDKVAIISHEASHIVDNVLEDMSETEVGTETRAYMLQSAVMAIMNQVGEEWLTQQQTKRNAKPKTK